MAEFYVEPELLRGNVDDFLELSGSVQRLKTDLDQVENELKGMLVFGGIRESLKCVYEELDQNREKLIKISIALSNICRYYIKAENNILGRGSDDDIDIDEIIDSIMDIYDIPGEDENEVWEYIKTALKQIVCGDFVDDANFLGTVGAILVGCIPYVGIACDIRDLIADIYNLIDDGPETMEWVALGFTLVGLIPAIGDFAKHADEVGDLLKGVNLNKLGDMVSGLMKNADDVISGMKRGIVDIWDDIANSDAIKELSRRTGDIVERLPDLPDKTIDFLNNFVDGSLKVTVKEVYSDVIETGLEKWEELRSDLGIDQWCEDGFLSAFAV